MELKRILARDSRSANEKAIKLYGREVMIVSSQRVDNQIELVVAVESSGSPETQEIRSTAGLEREVPKASAEPKGFGKVFHQAQLNPLDDEPSNGNFLGEQALPTKPLAPAKTHEAYRSEEIVALLRDEIANLREDLLLTMRTRLTVPASGLTASVQQLSQALAEAGMPASMRLLFESELLGVETAQDATALIRKTLLKTMKRRPADLPSVGWHAFLGPTGSGKTLMTARLAHLAASVHGVNKQALISFNDTRPGAWAQLQVLASQVGIDCYRAQDVEALKAVLDDLGPKRSVWVDTGGMQFSTHIADLKSAGLVVHGVIPLNVTATHAQKILLDKALGWSSVMVTKADEASPSWALLKCLGESQVPLSGISASADLKAGVLPYDPSMLIDLALGVLGLPPAALAVAAKKPRTSRASGARKVAVRKKQSGAELKVAHG